MTPSLKINEETGVVTFEEIEGAKYYNYVINDGNIQQTTSNVIALENKSNVSVQAVGENNVYSEWSSAVTFYDTSEVVIEGNFSTYNVYFHNTNLDVVQVQHGDKINRPNNPQKDNHVFDNWYSDPFYTTLFDFDKPIIENTIIYAHFNPTNLIDDVYFWVKANDKITSSIQSSFLSDSGWKFIPLKQNNNTKIREFEAVINVSNATSSTPAKFLIMDGFSDDEGRTYYKNNNSDFTITSNGIYKITFSTETLYMLGGNQVNAKYELITSQNINYLNEYEIVKLDTPSIEVDGDNNIAFISDVEGAVKYEVIINNGLSKIINTNQITLNKGEHISCRAIGENNVYSFWSIPKANISYRYENIKEEKTHAYVYFYESGFNAECVEINTYINEKEITKEGYNFLGWYLDISYKNKASFPYLVKDNVVFYPRFEAKNDLINKDYYELIDSNNNRISGFKWNLDNYDFYEYETSDISLNSNENYYVKSLDTNKKWGPYKVEESGTYTVYFSEEHIWDVNTEKAKNVYFAKSECNIYFTNALNWSGTIYAYMWNDASNQYYKAWPGKEMDYVRTNSYGQNIYKIAVDLTKYDYIIFNNGSSQTVDLSLENASNNSAFYTKNEKDGNGYKCGTYTYS